MAEEPDPPEPPPLPPKGGEPTTKDGAIQPKPPGEIEAKPEADDEDDDFPPVLAKFLDHLPDIMREWNKSNDDTIRRQQDHQLAMRKLELEADVKLKSKQQEIGHDLAVRKSENEHKVSMKGMELDEKESVRGTWIAVLVLVVGGAVTAWLLKEKEATGGIAVMTTTIALADRFRRPGEGKRRPHDDGEGPKRA